MEHIEIAEGIWVYENAIDQYKELEDIIAGEIDKSILKNELEGFSTYGSLVLYPDGEPNPGPLNEIFANIFNTFEQDYLTKNNLQRTIHGPFSIIYHEAGSWYKTMELIPPTGIRVMLVLSTDAVGGDFNFPDLGVTLQLKENSFIVFPENPNSEYNVIADKLDSGSRILVKSLLS